MELSSKVDVDLNDATLSFISGLSCKDDDSDILADSMNTDGCSQLDDSDLLKNEIVDSNQDLFNINFDKTSLNAEQTDAIINTLANEEASSLSDFTFYDSSLNVNAMPNITTSFASSVSSENIVETSSGKSTPVCNKNPTGTKILLLQNTSSNMQTMLVGSKNVSVSSASKLTIVQASPRSQSGTKILTMPTMSASGSLISSVSPSLTGKTGDLKIILSPVPSSNPTYVTAKTVGGNTTTQIPLKRAVAPTSNNQMVTKVILTNNVSSNPSIITPISVSAAVSGAGGHPQSILLASPNKTLTLPRNNIFNLSTSQQVLRPISGTPANQVVLSPIRAYRKPTTISAAYARSPRRIAPATNVTVSNFTTMPKLATIVCPSTVAGAPASRISIPASPTKVILKPAQTLLKPPLITVCSTSSSTTSSSPITTTIQKSIQHVTTTSSQPVQLPASKFHYVRLVSAPSTSANTTLSMRKETTIIPVCTTTAPSSNRIIVSTPTTSTNISQIRPTIPIAPARLVVPKQISSKILIPSSSGGQIRVTNATSSSSFGSLPPGTFIPVGGSTSSYVMLPAQYMSQLQQATSTQQGTTQVLNILPAPTTTTTSVATSSQSTFVSISSNAHNSLRQSSISPATLSVASHQSSRRTPVEIDNRQRKPCNCTKSQCLKLYCDCFANGEFCNNCNCNNCYNNLTHEEERQKAIKACLDRNPLAFHPKIGKSREGDQERRHTKGCNCKRSYCLKNYCECYEAKILCTNTCKCVGCKNFEDSSERKTLMHLADAAEVRVQQQAAAKTNFSSDIFDFPTKPPVISQTGEKLPFAFVTEDVLEATCLCLLSQANDAENSHYSEEEVEKMVLQEFGRCLVRIIDCANKTKVSKMDVQ